MNLRLQWWNRLRASFWFTPAVIVTASLLAAMVLVEVDARSNFRLAEFSPRLFGAGADGSRAMLSAIATSMATVAGVVFSITIVTLSLTSTQYSPRVLRNFMRDRPTQIVLGVFVGIFAYCLVVLRTIRDGDGIDFIPSIAVLVGILYALGGIAMLIFFIHHVALSIQAATILGRISDDTSAAIDHLFPQELGHPRPEQTGPVQLPLTWTPVHAARSGYVTGVDNERLMEAAVERKGVLRLCAAIGDYVDEGGVLLQASGSRDLPQDEVDHLRACVLLGRQRTVDQDAAFGLQQLVDVAVRALSPGVNDPATACMCVDRLRSLLLQLAGRHIPDSFRFQDGQLRVVAQASDFGTLVTDALRPVVRQSAGNLDVLARLVSALEVISGAATPERRLALRATVVEIQTELARVRPRARSASLRRRLRRLRVEDGGFGTLLHGAPEGGPV